MKKIKGFTLIELLVVIAIIGVLSSIVLASLSNSRERARVTKARMEINQLKNAIEYARMEQNATLRNITLNFCTYCNGPATYQTSMQRIMTAGNNTYQGLEMITLDPWGSHYQLDENEGEGGGCLPDYIRTVNQKVRYYFDYQTQYCKDNPQGTVPGWYISY